MNGLQISFEFPCKHEELNGQTGEEIQTTQRTELTKKPKKPASLSFRGFCCFILYLNTLS